MLIYTVHACRWGDREKHSYIVGVYTKKHRALKAAENEEEWRGGKYSCEVREWKPDQKNKIDLWPVSKVVKAMGKFEWGK